MEREVPMGRGRGVSKDGEGAYHRGSVASAGAASSSDISSSLSSVHIGSEGSSCKTEGPAMSLGRGATRGRRERVDEQYILRTKPDNINSKKGAGGKEIALATNYFEVISKPNWRLNQYRVDMRPDVDQTKVRRALMYEHKNTLPNFMFDGTQMFTTTRLSPDDSPVVLNSQRRDGSTVVITIKLVGEVLPTDYHYMSFFNMVMRQALDKMGLSQIRRDYFDPQSAHMFSAHKLEVWPGYVTSIKQHEEKIMLCCEIGNKVLRTDTVLDQITEIFKRFGSKQEVFRSSVEKALLGCIVITRYTNKTYRIDEIDWDKSPTSEFTNKNGEAVPLVKYYADKHGKTVRDTKQPLIISTPPLREQRAGNTGPIWLIPELCNMTGLSDEQRANFKYFS